MTSNNFSHRQNRIIKITPTPVETTEPVTLGEIKDWLIISHTLLDSMLNKLNTAVRLACENRTKQHFRRTNIEVIASIYKEFPLPRLPYVSLTSIELRNSDYAYETVASSDYKVDADILYLQKCGTFKIKYLAGYSIALDELPENIRLAMKSEMVHRHENKGDKDQALADNLCKTAVKFLTPFINPHYYI